MSTSVARPHERSHGNWCQMNNIIPDRNSQYFKTYFLHQEPPALGEVINYNIINISL